MGWWKLFNPRGESDQEPTTSIPRFHGQVSAPQTPRTACRQPRPIAHTSPVSHRLLRRRQILCIPHLLPESTVPICPQTPPFCRLRPCRWLRFHRWRQFRPLPTPHSASHAKIRSLHSPSVHSQRENVSHAFLRSQQKGEKLRLFTCATRWRDHAAGRLRNVWRPRTFCPRPAARAICPTSRSRYRCAFEQRGADMPTRCRWLISDDQASLPVVLSAPITAAMRQVFAYPREIGVRCCLAPEEFRP